MGTGRYLYYTVSGPKHGPLLQNATSGFWPQLCARALIPPVFFGLWTTKTGHCKPLPTRRRFAASSQTWAAQAHAMGMYHGLKIDTKTKCHNFKLLTCKETLRQVFIRVYRLEITSVMFVFSTQICELLPL